MSVCRLCRTEIDEGDRCPDEKACLERVRKNVQKTLSRLPNRPYFGGFDAAKAYREQMGRE